MVSCKVHLLLLPTGSRGLQYVSFKNVVYLKCHNNIGKDHMIMLNVCIDIYMYVRGICVPMNCAMYLV